MTRPRHRLLLPVLAPLLAAVLVPGAAEAATFEGETSQGKEVSLRTDADGNANRVVIGWRAPCGRGRFETRSKMVAEDAEAWGADAFEDTATYRKTEKGGFRSTIKLTIDARNRFDPDEPSAESWVGKLKVSVVVKRDGKVYTRCSLKRSKFTVTLPKG